MLLTLFQNISLLLQLVLELKIYNLRRLVAFIRTHILALLSKSCWIVTFVFRFYFFYLTLAENMVACKRSSTKLLQCSAMWIELWRYIPRGFSHLNEFRRSWAVLFNQNTRILGNTVQPLLFIVSSRFSVFELLFIEVCIGWIWGHMYFKPFQSKWRMKTSRPFDFKTAWIIFEMTCARLKINIFARKDVHCKL